MQIRLTVLGPRSGGSGPDAGALAGESAGQPVAACDVTVTAPAGTSLAAVTGALVAAAASSGVGPGAGGGAESVPVYAGGERLDPQRQTLGEPPLVDGAVVSLGGPAEVTAPPSLDGAVALLHVIAGPDAGGVHLLRGGTIRIGRSSEADVPLDDPDVSRLHCVVTVSADGGIAVADLGSTNGTSVDGRAVADGPTALRPGAALRLGESILRLETDPAGPLPVRPRLPTEPDHEGRLRVVPGDARDDLAGVPDAALGGAAGGVPGGAVPGARPPSGPATAGSGGAPQSPGHPSPGARYDDVADHRGAEPAGAHPPAAERGRGHGVPTTAGAGNPTDPVGGSASDRGAGRDTPVPTRAAESSALHSPATGAPATEVRAAPAVPRPAGVRDMAHPEVPTGDERTVGQPAPPPGRPAPTAAAPPSAAPPRGRRTWESPGDDAPARHPPHPGSPVPGARDHAPHAEGQPAARPGPDPAGPTAPTSPYANGPRTADRSAPGAGPSGAFPTPGSPDPGSARGPASPGSAEPVEHGRADSTPTSGGTTHGTGVLRTSGAVPDPSNAPRRARGIGAWARRIAGGRAAAPARTSATGGQRTSAPADPEQEARWPDPATVLLTALGPGPRLWEREPDHPDALTVRLGTAQRATGPVVPVTVDLRTAGSLGLAGPRARLTGLTRSVLAQLAALHAPGVLELVVIAADERREGAERRAEWSWAGWLPQARPTRGQDCRLLVAFDAEQAAARVGELTRRLDERLREDARPGGPVTPTTGPATVVLVDGHPGPTVPAKTLARLAAQGPVAGIHLLCLAETPPATPTSPVDSTLEAARMASPGFATCGEVALLSGAVATALRVLRRRGAPASSAGSPDPSGSANPYGSANPSGSAPPAAGGTWGGGAPAGATPGSASGGGTAGRSPGGHRDGSPAGSSAGSPHTAYSHPDPTRETHRGTPLLTSAVRGDADPAGWGEGDPVVDGGTTATVDAVSVAWAERFARALAPLRETDAEGRATGRMTSALPTHCRLLDALGLARATPAALLARWTADDREGGGRVRLPAGRAAVVLGAGMAGAVTADLAAGRAHLAVTGGRGSGKTELLRSLAAALAAGERPDRLGLLLVDGVVGAGGEGLRVCGELPHVSTYLPAGDPLRMREFAQALSGELKRRSEVLGDRTFEEYARGSRRSAPPPGEADPGPASPPGQDPGPIDGAPSAPPSVADSLGRRPESRQGAAAPGLPRLVLLVDDFDALVAPALGNPGRPAAGSVVRALEAVARDGSRLGVHLVTASGRPEHTSATAAHRSATLQVRLGGDGGEHAPAACPGRGVLYGPDGAATAFQAGRVSGRIPRTSTLRPTVVPLDWARAGDPPTRRPVRELGNGPTDLALLASAIERAARSTSATPVAPLS